MTRPPDTLRATLYLQKREGVPFAQAWQRAHAAALLDAPDNGERVQWRAALDETREEWKAAYYNRDASLLGYLALERDVEMRW